MSFCVFINAAPVGNTSSKLVQNRPMRRLERVRYITTYIKPDESIT